MLKYSNIRGIAGDLKIFKRKCSFAFKTNGFLYPSLGHDGGIITIIKK